MLCKNKNLEVSFDVCISSNEAFIAPSMLIPFVENAFKHRSHFDSGNYIHISADIQGSTLEFSVTNTYSEYSIINKVKKQGGIGLKNVSRRLELLYNDRHRLQIKKGNGIYTVKLQLELNEHAVNIAIAV